MCVLVDMTKSLLERGTLAFAGGQFAPDEVIFAAEVSEFVVHEFQLAL